MPLTAAPMAAALAQAGERVLARLANAELVFFSGSVFGLLSDEPAELMLGGMAVQARRKVFVTMAADLDALLGGVAEGAEGAINGTPWRVALRTEHPQTGQVTLTLERA